jgi:hypothetical protein
MQISGRVREGWMTVIPLSVLLFIVIVAFGGPSVFMSIVRLWVVDALAYVAQWLKNL